jgi:hypothetical protein
MFLEYLVPSKARRNLLHTLWKKRAAGSVSELARLAEVAVSAAEKEISAMEELGLVSVERMANARVVRANESSPFAASVRALLATEEAKPVSERPTNEQVRDWLASYGAPLVSSGTARSTRKRPSLEETLVHGLRVAHSDAAVTRTFPVLLWRNHERLRFPDLEHLARQAGLGRTLGFLSEVTAELTGDARFAKVANDLRDRRVRRDAFFFRGTEDTLVGKELAELSTSPAARRWHYLMNMPMESFESMFRKAVGASSTH